MKRIIDLDKDEEVNEAYWVAARGGISGAARWGLFSALVGTAAYVYSPIFRGLTIQFKVFMQMSSMTLGGMIEGDRRMRAHELVVRRRKRVMKEQELWRRYEAEFKELEEYAPLSEKQVAGAEDSKQSVAKGNE